MGARGMSLLRTGSRGSWAPSAWANVRGFRPPLAPRGLVGLFLSTVHGCRAIPAAIAIAVAFAGTAVGCGPGSGLVHPELAATAESDALAISDALEALIAEGKDTPADREYAYEQVTAQNGATAEYAFARAAVTGRLVQQRGLRAAHLVADVERWAIRSHEMDPSFRDGAALRMLGTLYVLAPAALLQHGDSEKGLEILERLVKERPHVVENHLRVAEAYIALGDRDPAVPSLCRALADKAKLRRDDQLLLDRLMRDAGSPSCASSPDLPR